MSVTVFSQPQCRSCDRVKAKLEEAGVEFDTVNILENQEAYTYVRDVLKATSVPVIVSDVLDPILGYQPDKLKELISELRV